VSDFLRRQVGHRKILPQRGTKSTKLSGLGKFVAPASRAPFCSLACDPFCFSLLNPANGSWRIVQVLAIYAGPTLLMNSSHLKYPPTSVGWINSHSLRRFYRKDLNDPPTAVGGIVHAALRVQLPIDTAPDQA
jgi:hypothetical protein